MLTDSSKGFPSPYGEEVLKVLKNVYSPGIWQNKFPSPYGEEVLKAEIAIAIIESYSAMFPSPYGEEVLKEVVLAQQAALANLEFPSPYGEEVLKDCWWRSGHLSRHGVSVPLRGRGFESEPNSPFL